MRTTGLLKLAVISAALGITGCEETEAPVVTNEPKAAEVKASTQSFNRIASFPVCGQVGSSCNTEEPTSAEILAVSVEGETLVYTNSPAEQLGFIDISNPENPKGIGTFELSGEPTSVAVKGAYALVAVNTSLDYEHADGELVVVDINTQAHIRSLGLGGQPDSIAISPDGQYALIAIENERNDMLCTKGKYVGAVYADEYIASQQCEVIGGGELGGLPQTPGGSLVIVDIAEPDPARWRLREVDVTGFSGLYPSDPEPEYVDINVNNIAVVTLQENNHIFLVDLSSGSIVNNFSAGVANLQSIDTQEETPAYIRQTNAKAKILREPDGVSWINTEYFATANEGDMDGGSRGFTIFNIAGDVVWDSGYTLDHMAVQYGHYPDDRSGNKGNEPENVELGVFDETPYLFVNAERSSLVFVYDVSNPKKPVFKQVLPAAVGPEGGLAIPSRNLLVVASEVDSRPDKIRSVVNLYAYSSRPAAYPTVQSAQRLDGTAIPWGAISGLSADPANSQILYAIEDGYFGSNRIYTLDVSRKPAVLVAETTITDSDNVFAGIRTASKTEKAGKFDEVDLARMINTDKSVNIDAEGIAKASDGGFWVASEGAGTKADAENFPIKSRNVIFKTYASGVIENVIGLPKSVNKLQVNFGFEGVAEYNGKLYVAFQRAWRGETNPRIGIYDIALNQWAFVYYPLDVPESQNGGWVGLGDISSMGEGKFLVVERDNQSGPDAALKRLYVINLSTYIDGITLSKTRVRDLMTDLARTGGLIPEKIEGAAVMANGDVYIINDNDGVSNNSGETQLINLGNILQ